MKHQHLIVALLALILSACGGSTSLDAKSFQENLTTTEKAILIDIRTPQEFANQHIPGAVNLDMSRADFEEQLASIDKEASIFFYCTSGTRSARAAKAISSQGFENSYELKQGIQSWVASGLAVQKPKPKPKPITYTSAQYDELTTTDDLVLVDFMADWCGPCRAMAPHIEKLKQEYEGKLKVVKINTDFNQELGARFNIMSIPTIKMYHEGELFLDQPGFMDEAQLRAALAPYL